MKKLLLLLMLAPMMVSAQFTFTCDSVIINCCWLDTPAQGEIMLTASNFNSDVIGYPGFILFDSNNDTIAKETVNYFGIGWGPQAHTMVVMNQPTLPFTGYLELWGGFWDTLRCTFPVTIADTLLVGLPTPVAPVFSLYPNPTTDVLNLSLEAPANDYGWTINVHDMRGRLVHASVLQGIQGQISTNGWGLPGLYMLTVRDEQTGLSRQEKFVIRP